MPEKNRSAVGVFVNHQDAEMAKNILLQNKAEEENVHEVTISL